jgi:hypothetical protein
MFFAHIQKFEVFNMGEQIINKHEILCAKNLKTCTLDTIYTVMFADL